MDGNIKASLSSSLKDVDIGSSVRGVDRVDEDNRLARLGIWLGLYSPVVSLPDCFISCQRPPHGPPRPGLLPFPPHLINRPCHWDVETLSAHDVAKKPILVKLSRELL